MAELAGYSDVKRNPHAIVLVGGDAYDSWNPGQQVEQVTVELTTDLASEALIRLFDPKFKIIDKYTTSDGVPQLVCKFYLGFGQDLGQPLFKGLLIRSERRDTDTVFRAYDMSQKMKQQPGRNSEYHKGLNDVALIEKLATRNGLAFEGPDEPVNTPPHKSMIQDAKNDWELAAERAKDAGLVLYCRQDTLFAKQPAKIGAPLITLTYQKDFQMLHNFDASFKLPENQDSRQRHVKHYGRNRGGKRLTGESNKHKRGTEHIEFKRDLAQHNKSYADRKAQASKDLQREHAWALDIRSIPPLPGVRPDNRDTIALANMGKLFSGPYLIDKVTHDLTAQGFVTDYSLYRDLKADG